MQLANVIIAHAVWNGKCGLFGSSWSGWNTSRPSGIRTSSNRLASSLREATLDRGRAGRVVSSQMIILPQRGSWCEGRGVIQISRNLGAINTWARVRFSRSAWALAASKRPHTPGGKASKLSNASGLAYYLHLDGEGERSVRGVSDCESPMVSYAHKEIPLPCRSWISVL
jgi:hypothetical protein